MSNWSTESLKLEFDSNNFIKKNIVRMLVFKEKNYERR